MFEFKVRPDHAEPYEVTATSRDVLVWERTTKGRTLQALAGDPAMVDMYKIAFLASQRQGMFHGTQQEFEAQCEIDFEDEPEPDPTQPEASAGP